MKKKKIKKLVIEKKRFFLQKEYLNWIKKCENFFGENPETWNDIIYVMTNLMSNINNGKYANFS